MKAILSKVIVSETRKEKQNRQNRAKCEESQQQKKRGLEYIKERKKKALSIEKMEKVNKKRLCALLKRGDGTGKHGVLCFP